MEPILSRSAHCVPNPLPNMGALARSQRLITAREVLKRLE